MICPTCGTHIADDLMRCPACHANVAMTESMPAVQGQWCPSCGAGVPWEAEVCPHCGLPVDRSWAETPKAPAKPQVAQPDDEGLADEVDQTHVVPRIESAIPAEDDPTSKLAVQDQMPHAGRLILASVFSIALVCSIALTVAHPWNLDAHSIKATKEADTSTAGFPGTVESLTGQDSGAGSVETTTDEDPFFARLMEDYQKLGRYEERTDQSFELFARVGLEGTQSERSDGKHEAELLAIDVAKLSDGLDGLEEIPAGYQQDVDHLKELAGWLRERVEVLAAIWKVSAESEDEAPDAEAIGALAGEDVGVDGSGSCEQRFTEHYEQWQPQKAEVPEEEAQP